MMWISMILLGKLSSPIILVTGPVQRADQARRADQVAQAREGEDQGRERQHAQAARENLGIGKDMR